MKISKYALIGTDELAKQAARRCAYFDSLPAEHRELIREFGLSAYRTVMNSRQPERLSTLRERMVEHRRVITRAKYGPDHPECDLAVQSRAADTLKKPGL